MLMYGLADSGFGLLGRFNDPTIQKCIGSDLIFCYFWIKPLRGDLFLGMKCRNGSIAFHQIKDQNK